jgi:hypothetical protein
MRLVPLIESISLQVQGGGATPTQEDDNICPATVEP